MDEAVALFSDNNPNEVIWVADYATVLLKLNQAIESLREHTTHPASVDLLKGEQAKLNFVKRFRNVLRNHMRIQDYQEYTPSDITITEQELANFSSKKKLIEKFINEQLVHISNPQDIHSFFFDFIADEREKALMKLSQNFNLQAQDISNIIETSVWRDQAIDKNEITKLFKGKLPFREIVTNSNLLVSEISEFTYTFSKGW